MLTYTLAVNVKVISPFASKLTCAFIKIIIRLINNYYY